MRKITEDQAQELANLSGCIVFVCMDDAVKIKTKYGISVLPIYIQSKRAIDKKIWRPQE